MSTKWGVFAASRTIASKLDEKNCPVNNVFCSFLIVTVTLRVFPDVSLYFSLTVSSACFSVIRDNVSYDIVWVCGVVTTVGELVVDVEEEPAPFACLDTAGGNSGFSANFP